MFLKPFICCSIVSLFCGSTLQADPTGSLINREYIRDYLTHEAPWHQSHQAEEDYLGAGMLYYALAYAKKTKVCVCLGSGGAFVPRIMCQAQRDLNLKGARTVLIDADIGVWGRPQWINLDSFFRKNFPEIQIILDTTHHAALNWNKAVEIDYLHIDANHSQNASWREFKDYLPLMASYGVITFHDTNGPYPCAKTLKKISEAGYEVVNFKEFGAGVDIIHLGRRITR